MRKLYVLAFCFVFRYISYWCTLYNARSLTGVFITWRCVNSASALQQPKLARAYSHVRSVVI